MESVLPTADLQQSIINTVYLTFAHNYIAFAYLIGVIIGISLSFFRPSRFSTLILLGFVVLLFSYEYDKHIIDPLRNQTLQSLISTKPHFKVQKLINLLISEILPIFFYVSGWALIFAAILKKGMEGKKKI